MGVDTKLRIKEIVDIKLIETVCKKHFDDVKINVRNVEGECGWILFNYKGEARNLFFGHYSDSYDEDGKYVEVPMYTYLSLGCWGSSVEIMTIIAEYFGGWLDENDCDDIDYFFIPKSKNIDIENNYMELYTAIAKEFNCSNTEKVINFIQQNEDLIKKLNYGKHS